jgi:hypothetical protein
MLRDLEQPTGLRLPTILQGERMIITVAKGSRIPQAQAAFTEHPRLYLRLLRAVSRMGSPPSPEGTSVITGHDPWIVRAQTSRCTRLDKSRCAHPYGVIAHSQPWCLVLACRLADRAGLTPRTLLFIGSAVKSRNDNDCLRRSEPALLHECDVISTWVDCYHSVGWCWQLERSNVPVAGHSFSSCEYP